MAVSWLAVVSCFAETNSKTKELGVFIASVRRIG